MNNTLLPISKNPNGIGYVYICKIRRYCDNEIYYKIGSTKNIDKRLIALASHHNATVNLIDIGFSWNRIKTEAMIQQIILNANPSSVSNSFWWSREYFKMSECELKNVIYLLQLLTTTPAELSELMKKSG